jgi:hypothetical protein
MNGETVPVGRRRRPGATVPLWPLIFLSALSVVVCVSLWAYIAFTRPTAPQPTSAAVFIVVTPAGANGSATVDPLSTTLTPGAISGGNVVTPTVPANNNPGFINLGTLVEVAHTDGAPLKLRAAPSLTAEVNYLALPSEVFKVQDGPTVADGFTWWRLIAPSDQTRSGWAVENYLQASTSP